MASLFPSVAFACGGAEEYPQYYMVLGLALLAFLHVVLKANSFQKGGSPGMQELIYARRVVGFFFISASLMILANIGSFCLQSPADAYIDDITGASATLVSVLSLFSIVYTSVLIRLMRKRGAIGKKLVTIALALVVLVEIILIVTLLTLTVFFPNLSHEVGGPGLPEIGSI